MVEKFWFHVEASTNGTKMLKQWSVWMKEGEKVFGFVEGCSGSLINARESVMTLQMMINFSGRWKGDWDNESTLIQAMIFFFVDVLGGVQLLLID